MKRGLTSTSFNLGHDEVNYRCENGYTEIIRKVSTGDRYIRITGKQVKLLCTITFMFHKKAGVHALYPCTCVTGQCLFGWGACMDHGVGLLKCTAARPFGGLQVDGSWTSLA